MLEATIQQHKEIGFGWWWTLVVDKFTCYGGYAFTRQGAEFAAKRAYKIAKKKNKRYTISFEALDGENNG